jgi:hypothetical protein
VAALSRPHWETTTPELRAVLEFAGRQSFAGRFYLAGGTALALRVGHRRSYDLDFFSATDEVTAATRREIVAAFAERQAGVIEDVDGNLLLLAGGVSVGYFSYGYQLLDTPDLLAGTAIASVRDIGLMKLDALISRGSRKDFYDTYVVAQQVPIADLLRLGEVKYPYARDFEVMAVEALVQFENADRDRQPDLLIDLPWDRVRQYFVEQARALGRNWTRGRS